MMSLIVFFCVFAVYLSCVFPCVAPGESGEITAGILSSGILLDPGRFFYGLLCCIFVRIVPFGNEVFRLNVLSALLGAASVILVIKALKGFFPNKTQVSHALYELEQSRWKNTSLWITAVLWALAPEVWRSSAAAEPYALGLLMSTVVFWRVSLLYQADVLSAAFAKQWRLTVFLLGISMSIAPGLIFWTPGMALVLWIRYSFLPHKPPVVLKRTCLIVLSTLFFLCAGYLLQPFVFFVLNPSLVLRGPEPDLFTGIKNVFLYQLYVPFSFLNMSQGLMSWSGFKYYFSSSASAFTLLGLVFAGWGCFRFLKQKSWLLLVALVLWFFSGPVHLLFRGPCTDYFSQGLVARFFPFSFAGLLVLMAWGLYHTGLRWPLCRVVGALLIPISLFSHLPVSGRHDFLALDFGADFLKSVPPQSILLVQKPSALSLLHYQQRVLKNREDVLLTQTRVNPEALPFDAYLFSDVPQFPWVPSDDENFSLTHVLPMGLAYRYFPAHAYKLVHPPSQLSLAMLTFWWYRGPFINTAEPQKTSFSPMKTTSVFSPDWLSFSCFFESKDPLRLDIVDQYDSAHIALGKKFARHELFDMTKQAYLAASPKTNVLLGNMAYDQGHGARAAVFFKCALSGKPNDFDLTFKLGMAYLMSGKDRQALSVLHKAIELQPAHEQARFELANVLEKNGAFREALGHWKILRDLDTDNKDYYWHLTHTYVSLGNTKKAVQCIDEYLLLGLTPKEKARAEDFRYELLDKI